MMCFEKKEQLFSKKLFSSIEISKVDTLVEHKRRELELSFSVLARVDR